MPLFLLMLLGIGGYVLYRRSQSQQQPPMFQGQVNTPLLQGGVTIPTQKVPPINTTIPVQLTQAAISEEYTNADNAVPIAQLVANGTTSGLRTVIPAENIVSLIPDPKFVGTELVLFADNKSGKHWITFAKDFHWVPAA